MRRIAVAGDGAWGTALAHVARSAGHDVALWTRENPDAGVIARAEAIIMAVPAQALGAVVQRLDLAHGPKLIIAAKGIEQASGRFMNEVAEAVAPAVDALILSGPSFAADVVKGLPTAVTLAGPTFAMAKDWGDALSLPHFRIYASDDVRGVEIGGALKNVLAIACGIADGRRLGDSARAALTTRGFAELSRFGRTLGARPETLMGLSGLGDLLLTCSSRQSRNYSFGFAIGEGRTAHEAMSAAKGVVEGAFTAAIAVKIAHDKGVDMPIAEAVDAIINRGSDPETEIARLLARPAGAEHR
ncbi:MAG TPA: NAD(P)H-dependent glycerol-3-phosphate dehydrogenase [Aestuariivirga sp.]|nr:NAD(P)H-dependent glycerol-3-phosphate dehydrogenase [Aestuariivirga sp.]